MRFVLFLLVQLFAGAALAADLTPQQTATLKTAALANPTVVSCNNVGDDTCIANWLNDITTTVVWATSVSVDRIMRSGMDWTRVDNLTVGKARIWDWMTRLGSIDCSRQNTRAGIDAVWVGTAADLAVRALVYSQCKRYATRAEALLATGAGTDASPAVMGWEGVIDPGLAGTILRN